MERTWDLQVFIFFTGIALLWWMRSERLKSTNEQRRRQNWFTVPIFAIVTAELMFEHRNAIHFSHILFAAAFLAAYTWFVYRWNLAGVDDD